MWSNCWGKDRVVLAVQVISYTKSIPSSYSTEFWTYVDTIEEEVLSNLAHYVVTFCLKITDGRPQGVGNNVIRYVIWSVTTPITGYQTYQSVQSPKLLSTKEEPIQFFSCLQVVAYHTNHWTFKICINIRKTVEFFRVIWGWKLFCTREHKDSVGEILTKVYSI